MSIQQNQTYRVLSMYERLSKGGVLTKVNEANRFGVGEKTIQRDLESIRTFLETEKVNQFLEYDRTEKVYKLNVDNQSVLRKEEILGVVKILVESRAFPKNDMKQIINKLTDQALPQDRVFIEKLMLNEEHLYVDLKHKKSLFDLLWTLAEAVYTKRVIHVKYRREHDKEEKQHILKPLGIIFSEYYFYLIADQTKRKMDFPTIYRVDRIASCEVQPTRFRFPYQDRFQEGEFRQRIQFMYTGDLLTIKFKFTGASPQAVLDRLPTARIIDEKADYTMFKAEVFGNGIKMWLLSQGEYIEVLEPEGLRKQIMESAMGMVEKYQ
ncbi:WYL domain-containing protein [Priestia sp. FSL W8-0524]|uniref:helix-turn-helix transcriptional regulator n=1 Tax=Priestia sp. FSL W8-0524 TaxID=2954625 RepID=UPI0030F964CE